MMGPAVKVDRYYDRKCRSWVVMKLDAEGNQVGEASYTGTRAGADLAEAEFRKEIAP